MSIPVFRPSIKRKEMDAVLSCLVSDRIGPGDLTKKLNHAAAGYVNCESAIAFRENQRALSCALLALEIEPGSSVIVTPLAPAYYIDALVSLDIKPLYCDVEENGCVISPDRVEKLIGYNPKAIIVSTTLGFVPDLKTLSDMGIPMIEDISQGFGANTGEDKAGSYGLYTLVSLEHDSLITAGGGCLLLCRGRKEKTAVTRVLEHLDSETLLLPDMNSALGIQQIEYLEKHIQKRKEIAQVYSRAAAKTVHKVFTQQGEAENIYYSFPVLLNTGMKDVIKYAARKGVETFPAFENSAITRFQVEETPCPSAQSMVLRCLLFPLYPLLGRKNIEFVVKVLSTLP